MKTKTQLALIGSIWLSTLFTGARVFALTGLDGKEYGIVTSAPPSAYVEIPTSEKTLRAEESKWNNSGISQTQLKHLQPIYESPNTMPITLVMSTGNIWEDNKALKMLEHAQELFKQCDLALSPVTIVHLEHPMFNKVECTNDYAVTQDLPKGKNRPMLIFKGGPQCSYGPSYANVPFFGDHAYEKDSVGTIFMESQILTLEFPYPDLFYGAIAHELMHILLSEPHNFDAGNIMSSNPSTRGKKISQEQCKKMLNHPYVNHK